MNEQHRQIQLQHIREALANNERSHTPEEVAAAIERAPILAESTDQRQRRLDLKAA